VAALPPFEQTADDLSGHEVSDFVFLSDPWLSCPTYRFLAVLPPLPRGADDLSGHEASDVVFLADPSLSCLIYPLPQLQNCAKRRNAPGQIENQHEMLTLRLDE
jgi:hypothetical protein